MWIQVIDNKKLKDASKDSGYKKAYIYEKTCAREGSKHVCLREEL